MSPSPSPPDEPGGAGEWSLTAADDWIAATCRPLSGSGTLARVGRVVLAVASSDAEAVAPLLEQAELVAANGGEGRQLVRGFALLLGTASIEPPAFVALAPHETGLAVLAVGDAVATVDGMEISGRDSLSWAERLVPWPIRSLEVRVDPAAAVRPGLRLESGVVEAGGFGLGPRTPLAAPVPVVPAVAQEPPAVVPVPVPVPDPVTPVVEEAAPPTPAEPTPVPVAVPPAPAAVLDAPAGPVGYDAVKLDDIDEPEPLPPLPLGGEPSQVHVATPAAEPVSVRGVYCKNHHFNDPQQLFCAICGINMVQQTPVLVAGLRPPLGVIVLDDGAVFQLDRDFLLGRDPDADARVRSGLAHGLHLEDTSHQVSRVHARIELRGWEVVVVDNDSTNGTYVAPPDAAGWVQLANGGKHRLVQGTRVRIGHRTMAFNTHAGQ